jgi:septum formation protein
VPRAGGGSGTIARDEPAPVRYHLPVSDPAPPPLVLASASPRRRALLEAAGLALRVAPQDVDEGWPGPSEPPLVYVARVAEAKALAYAGAPAIVLAADTTVALDGEVLAKPVDDDDARRMLTRLSDRTHHVHTAVAVRVVDADGALELEARRRTLARTTVTTEVRFRRLGAAEIARYVATGEPRDKAGAYAIQGGAGGFVAALSGSYTNVVGLPLEETLTLLRAAGLSLEAP